MKTKFLLSLLLSISFSEAWAVPPNPSGLTATAASDTAIDLSWTSGGGTTASFRIAWQTGASAPADCDSGTQATSGTNSYQATGLAGNTQYSFRVCAVDGSSVRSSGVTVTRYTLATDPSTGLYINNWGWPSFRVFFDDSANESSYIVGFNTGSTPATCAGAENTHTGAQNASFIQVGFAEGARLNTSFGIRLCTVNGEGVNSPGVVVDGSWVTSSFPAVDFTSSNVTTNSADIGWTQSDSTPNESGFKIVARTGADPWCNNQVADDGTWTVASGFYAADSTSGSLSSLTPNTTYRFRVCSSNSENHLQQGSSAVQQFTTLATNITDLAYDPNNSNANAIRLTWTDTDETSYRVAYATGSTPPADCSGGTAVAANSSNTMVGSLSPNTEYSIRLCPLNAAGVESAGDTVSSVYTLSENVANLSATPLSDSSLRIDFDDLTHESGYRLVHLAGAFVPLVQCTGGFGGTITNLSANDNSEVITGLNPNTYYNIRVCSLNGYGTYSIGSQISYSDYTLATDPTGLGATVASSTQIDLSWTDSANESSYAIAYQTGGTAPANCASGTTTTAVAGATSASISSLSANTQYSFRLCAVNAAGDNNSGITVTATTAASEASGLSLSAASTTQLDLSWTDAADETSYAIAYQSGGTAPANCSAGTTTTALQDATSASLTGLSANTQYSVRLCSVNGASAETGGITANAYTLAAEASGLTATVDSATQITLDWTDSANETDYMIRYTTGASAPADCTSGTSLTPAQDANTQAVTGLSAGTQYSFRLCARNGGSVSTAGITVSATTDAAAPPDPISLNLSAASATSFDASWASGGGTTNDYIFAYNTVSLPSATCSDGTTSIESGTSKTVTGLAGNTTYYVRVCARNAGGDASSGVTGSVVTLASEASALSLASASTTALNVSWTDSADEASYVYAYTTGATAPADCTTGTTGTAAQNATSASLTGLTANTQYSLRLCTVSSGTDHSAGITASAYTLASDPSGPGATGASSSQINLSWSDSANESSYAISYQTGGTAPANCSAGTTTTAAQNATGANITSLAANTQYSFRICGVNGAAAASAGVTASAWTLAGDASGLTLTPASTTQLNMSWTDASNETSYAFAYTTGGTAPADCSTGTTGAAAQNATSANLTGLSGNTQYSVRLCGLNGGSDESAGITASAYTLAAQPSALGASASSATAIALSWTDSADESSYAISYQTGGTAPADCASGSTTTALQDAASASITGLTALTQYSFRLCALNGDGVASAGITATATTEDAPAPNPTGVTLTINATDGGSLSWTSAGGSSTDWLIAQDTSAIAANCASGTTSTQALGTTTLALSGYSPNTTIHARVCARNADGTASSGVAVSEVTLANNATTFSATASAYDEIDLSWAHGAGTRGSYKIAYQTGATAPADCNTGTTSFEAGTATTSNITGLVALTQYSFRLCTLNSATAQSAGVTATATTLTGPSPDPTGLTLSNITHNSVDLSWTNAGGPTTGFYLAYGTSLPADCTGAVTDLGLVTSTSVTGLSSNTTYHFRVCSYNVSDTRSAGATANNTTLDDPAPEASGLAATVDSPTQITLNWTNNGGTTQGFVVASALGSSPPADCSAGTDVGNVTTAVLSALSAGTDYAFRVCAYNNDPSNTSGVTTTASTPAIPILSLAAATFSGDEDNAQATIVLTRTNADGAVSVELSTTAGTATAGVDYTEITSQLVSWADGDAAPKAVTVTLNDDSLLESGETVNISLANPTGGAALNISAAVLTINDDEDSGVLQFVQANQEVYEVQEKALIIVQRTGGSTGPMTADVVFTDATATGGGVDYDSSSIPISFADGQTETLIEVPITKDALFENSESFVASIANVSDSLGARGPAGIGAQSFLTLNVQDYQSIQAESVCDGVNRCLYLYRIKSNGERDLIYEANADGTGAFSFQLTLDPGLYMIEGYDPADADYQRIKVFHTATYKSESFTIDKNEALVGTMLKKYLESNSQITQAQYQTLREQFVGNLSYVESSIVNSSSATQIGDISEADYKRLINYPTVQQLLMYRALDPNENNYDTDLMNKLSTFLP